jgi:hypothetical protein
MTPLWRRAFDAIERPLAAGSEAWIQSETFMDLATVSFRVQRRLMRDLQLGTERWLHAWGGVSRGDVLRLSNQVASLERQVRELRSATDPERDGAPPLNGRAQRPRTRTRSRTRQANGRRTN